MEVQRARMMSEMYAVLTAEQKAQLATERQQREQKRQERRNRRNANAVPTSRT
jgi:Spy/CpxP family protein refolding chaperone